MTTAGRYSRIPRLLAERILSGRCILFVGSGASTESGAPTAAELAKDLADRYLDGHHRDEPLAKVAAYVEHKPGLGRRVLIKHIAERVCNLIPSKGHLELTRYPWTAIYTTNYDELIEHAYATTSLGKRGLIKILTSADLSKGTEAPRSEQILLLKPHGCVSAAYNKEVPLVISEDDYLQAKANRAAILRLLEVHRYTTTFLFAGYSFSDPDLGQVWWDVSSELGRLSEWAYAIWPGCSEEQRQLWRHRYVEIVDCKFSEFFDELAQWATAIPTRSEQLTSEALPAIIGLLMGVMGTRQEGVSQQMEKLAKLVELIGLEMRLSDGDLMDLKISAFAHNIGMVGVSDQVLLKPDALSPSEFAALRNHVVIGERILLGVPGLSRISKIVRAHHERYDGAGYPDGLTGDRIPIVSRILNAADTFLTLVSDRPYRRAIPLELATLELERAAGKSLDPNVTSVLTGLLKSNRAKNIL